MIESVIFDMDGLMIETEHLQSQAFEHVLRGHGIEPQFNEDGVIQTVGLTARDNLVIFKEKHGIDEGVDTLLSKKQAVYGELLKQNIAPKEGLLDLIKALKQGNLRLAVASSSSLEHIELVLKELGVSEDFDTVVSGETVSRGKPHPDIFLEAAKRLNVQPGNCVVFEDAESGVVAAKAAGMKVIAIPNMYTKSHDFSKADVVLPSLTVINLQVIAAI